MKSKTSITIASTAYNEALALPKLLERLFLVEEGLKEKYEFRYMICDNGSSDSTLDILKSYSEKYKKFNYVSLSRNFGHQGGLIAALKHSDGDLVVMMDADGQHPPELIPELVKKWEEGYNIVNTKKIDKNITFTRSVVNYLFYGMMKLLTGFELGEGDFRLMEKKVYKGLVDFPETEKFIRGLVSWQGFKHCRIPYVVEKRIGGKSKFKLYDLFNFALHGITTFSTKPLRMMVNFGILTVIPSSLFLSYILIQSLLHYSGVITIVLPPGWLTLSVTIVFFGAIQLLSIGILGEYVGKIYTEVKNRPAYIINELSEKNDE